MAKYRKKVCSYCRDKSEPNYKDIPGLRRYTTEKGKIVPRTKTGVCAKHGRALSTAIKRARYIGLLPFATKIK
jgi:small subunit ribosomal protein S18